MFFPRLRRQAKWVFVFLALVFGVGFVAFGVGSSLPGTGVIDFFESGDSTGLPSVGDAQDAIEDNPKDAQAHLDLSRAYQREGDLEAAIPPLVTFTTLRPNDIGGLQELASLYTTQATRAREEATIAQAEANLASGIASFFDSQELSQIFGAGDIDRAVQDDASARIQDASNRSTAALDNASKTYEKAVKVEPADSDLWYLLGATAEQASKNELAMRAYRQYLKLAPEGAEAAFVRERIKTLATAGQTSVSPGGVTTITR
jgi:predicted TPR repeat methyltransferase